MARPRQSPKGEIRGQVSDPRPAGALAVHLIEAVLRTGRAGLVYVGGSEYQLEPLAKILWSLAPDIETLLFPPWDCLPYDRMSPAARIMGLRIRTLERLAAGGDQPRLVLTTAEGLIQRVPRAGVWADATMRLMTGQNLDLDGLAADLRRTGYHEDDRVDEAGEFAIRGHVIDVFPAGFYHPVRLEHEAGRITTLASFDATSQRRTDHFDTLNLRPVSEAVVPRDGPVERLPGLEHRLPELHPKLALLLDYVPDGTLVLAPDTDQRVEAFLDQARDAYEMRSSLPVRDRRPAVPTGLYLDRLSFDASMASRSVIRLEIGDEDCAVPGFATASRPWEAFAAFLREQVAGRHRIVVTAAGRRQLAGFAAAAERALGYKAQPVETWDGIVATTAGSLLSSIVELDRGFVHADTGTCVLAPADLFGSRHTSGRATKAALGDGDEDFALGDVVVHLLHGVGVLDGIETLAPVVGEPTDTIRLAYAKGAKLMVPVDEIELMWRYGSASGKTRLDTLGGESWPKRRAKVEAEIEAAASAFVEAAAARRSRLAPTLQPDRRAYERLAARFPFTLTPDQAEAVDAILADLASGRPMNRLVCGDVGFGKTEVALRAAAAAALSGKQVALVAPTTVLVRQHREVFARRFAELGLEVANLSRLVRPAEARRVKAGLKEGSIRIVVGTHAAAGKTVSFADLGLVIVDEEQRFGAADKARLNALAADAHMLSLSATPIPRTLQAALVGLQDVSILATPPAERQPIRTVVCEADNGTIRTALLREKRRGGQSFVVCPRIEDMPGLAQRLEHLAPELEVREAHGRLPVEEIDAIMVGFAAGDGDVLLATNIIESGLDVPRANTMLVFHADRFGLGQLHQLRGRVGRGRLRGTAYLFTDPGVEIAEATRLRLRTLERNDRLGAGFAISAEDLRQRGAGDLLGDTQAGHVKLIGSSLYRRLLERTLAAIGSEERDDGLSASLNLGIAGRLPDDYVPEAAMRLNLYARLSRILDEQEAASFVAEIEDRFGPMPAAVATLLRLAKVKRLCRPLSITRIDAGQDGIAFTLLSERDGERLLTHAGVEGEELRWKDGRLIAARHTTDEDRLDVLEDMLFSLESAAPPGRRRR